ncbi:MAG: transposase [Sutterella wadsworthensis]
MRLEMMVRLHLLQISLNYSDLQMEVYLTSNVAARLFCRVPSGRTTVSDTSLLRFRGVSGLLCLGRLFQGQPNEAALSFL